MPKLSVIIVNWNSERYLRECLPTVFRGAAGIDCEVIVVDSASPGNGIDALSAEFPTVRFIRSAENIGFGRANNLGFVQSCGEYVLFLNPDTLVSDGALTRMIETLEGLPTAGILGCKLLNSDGTLQLSAIQPFPTILNQMLGTDWLQRTRPECRLWRLDPMFVEDGPPVAVQGVSGACLLIRRVVFERIGGFSSEYFMYAEDVDLCFKAALAGWGTFFTPSAVIVHHGGGSSRQRPVSGWSAVVQQHAKYMFLEKFRGRTYAWRFRAAIGVVAAIRVGLLAVGTLVRAPRDGSSHMRAGCAKWMAILKWSVGAGDAMLPAVHRNR